MRRIPDFSSCFAWSLLAALGPGVADAQDNIVPIEVRQLRDGQFNRVFVDVTVCNAALQCRTVPNVNVDTGAVGLHLYRKALDGLDLDAVSDGEGRPLYHGSIFGMGPLWGPTHWAQVRLGQVATSQPIPIQLFDLPSPLESLPASFRGDDARQRFVKAGNGVLGISPRRHATHGYFAYAGAGDQASDSDWIPVVVDESLKLANPIGQFPAPYDTGSVIRLPDVDWGGGHKQVQGWLGLGIGAPTESLFRVGARKVSHELDKHGKFAAAIGERRFDVLVDSGSNVLMLDLDHLGIARCASIKSFYDVATLTPLALTVTAGANEIELARPLYVGPAAELEKSYSGYGVLPALAIGPYREGAPSVLGLPFFYGRTVATGLQGSANPFHDEVSASNPLLSFDVEETVSLDDDEVASVDDNDLATAPSSWPKSAHGFIVYTD
jgi:hypothetical protein